MAAKQAKSSKATYKWNTESTRALIRFRSEKEDDFLKNKQAPKKLWNEFIQEAGLVGKVAHHQAAKKWENLKTRYKELKALENKTGSGSDAGEKIPSSWQYYQDMHDVMAGRPSIDPPLLVSTCSVDEDPTTLLLEIVDGASSSDPATADGASTALTPTQGASTASTSAQGASPSSTVLTSALNPKTPSTTVGLGTPSLRKKKRKSNPIVDFLKVESEREQTRHEESEAKTERFLALFERMVDKL